MSSLIAHAALPFVARRAVAIPPQLRRRFWLTVVLCACAPDLDWLGAAFQIPATSLWAHRGLTHSLVAALVVALVAGLLGFRALRWGSRLWWQVVAFLFAATAAHGLVDAMTYGDVGVAFFAPFVRTRYFLPFQPLPVCPLGIDEYLGRWGLFTLLDEVLYLLGPALLIATWIGAWAGDPDSRPETFKKLSLGAAVWGIAVVFLRTLAPEIAIPERPRILRDLAPDRNDPDSDENPARIPLDLLPDQHLVTRLDDLRARHLFDHELKPAQEPWSSSFFPWWYGGEAGRWQESRAVLVARTLVGMKPPSEAEARQWLVAADAGQPDAVARLFTLAPTEKMDLADGDFAFPLTSATLARTHNGQPRYWYGRCNGIASAAMEEPEPFRVVEVIGRAGQRLLFHPNDVKALLAAAYYRTSFTRLLGGRCGTVAFDSGAECSMNPGGLVLALANVLGLGGHSFMVDALPTPANQYYAVAAARMTLGGEPRPVTDEEMEPTLAGRVKTLQDVEIELTLSSTTLSFAPADVRDPAHADGTFYERVGLVPVQMRYRATLALDSASEIRGGKWNGDPANGPDHAVFVEGGPRLTDGGDTLEAPEVLSWPFIRALARASVDATAVLPTVDLREPLDGGT